MNMASVTVFVVVIVVLVGKTATAFVSMQCKPETRGQYGQKSVMDCMVKTSEEVEDPQFILVSWKKKDTKQPLVEFYKGQMMQLPGYSFAEPSWNNKNMNVSFLISNTSLQDEGTYSCDLMLDSGTISDTTRLRVTARYSTPTITSTPEKITSNTEGVLECKSHGGYPKGELRWFDEHNADWSKSAQMEVTQTGSGLFQLSSKLTLLRGSIFPSYTCVVFNASRGKEDRVTIDITPEKEELTSDQKLHSKVIAPLLVIGSVIVGLLAVLLYRQRTRSRVTNGSGRHHEVETHEDDIEEGVEDG